MTRKEKAACSGTQTCSDKFRLRNRHRSRQLRAELLEDRSMLAVLTVNTLMGDGEVSSTFNNDTLTLREAIALVNNGGPSGFTLSQGELDQIDATAGQQWGFNDRIIFQNGLAGTLQLANVFASTPGQLDITKTVAIEGRSDASAITIRAFDGPNPSTPIDDDSTNDGDGGRLI